MMNSYTDARLAKFDVIAVEWGSIHPDRHLLVETNVTSIVRKCGPEELVVCLGTNAI
jgi:hypothetical protein